MTRPSARRWGPRSVALLACVVLTSCFEEPIREHLHLHLGDGAVVAVWTHDISAPDRAEGNPALAARMEESREAVERGQLDADRWFGRLNAAASRFEIERIDGTVRHARWSAVVTNRRALENLLVDMGLSGLIQSATDGSQLDLEVTGASRATRSEREQAEDDLRRWSVTVTDYLAATIDLYAYLERSPDRAVACFSHLFEEGDVAQRWPISDLETELLGAVADAVDEVGGVLVVGDDRAYSPNELSRLVFDPFPARLTVTSDTRIVGSAGWAESGEVLERRPVSLWQALRELDGVWITPDLATAIAAPAPIEEQPEPVAEDFAALPRRFAAAPSAYEVEHAVRERLTPSDELTVQWAGGPPGSVELEDVRSLLDVAVAALPRR